MKTYISSLVLKRFFICLLSSCLIFSANAQTVSTIAGGAGGYLDGIVSPVEFYGVNGVAKDSKGNIYISDRLNNRIRKLSAAGIVSNFAGNGIEGFADGKGNNAEFNSPCGLAIDSFDNIIVADANNNRIRKITQAGVVTTLAGNGVAGFADGPALNAEFYAPDRLAIDSIGNIYISDFLNDRIRKLSTAGQVTTYAGSGIAGYLDGSASTARFYRPNGVAFDAAGNLYVAEYKNNRIRKISKNAVVSTVAGNGVAGHIDGYAFNAEFNGPAGIAVDKNNNIFVTDQDGNYVRKISGTTVSTFSGTGIAGFIDSTASFAQLNNPRDIFLDKSGNLYVSDFNNNSLRKVNTSGRITTVAGNGIVGYVNGKAENAELYGPNATAADAAGNIYVAEWLGNRIRKISPDGVVTTIAGDGTIGFKNGKGIKAEFHTPSGIAVDSKNNIYVTEANNHCVRKIDTAGNVTTFAGNGTPGYQDGTGTNALFSHPNRVTVDAKDNLYIADVFNYRIRKITPKRVVSTIAGNGIAGYIDGNANAAEFNYPNGVAVDTAGNVFVADYNNNRIRKISKAGIVSTVAGNGIAGYLNGNGTHAEFNHPGGICINAKGDFYITDEVANRIRKMTASYDVSLLAGNGIAGDIDGAAASAEFNDPRSIGIDVNGNVYVPDYLNNHIRKIEICDCTLPPTGLTTKKITSTSALLKWNLIECAEGYRVQYKEKGTASWTIKNISNNKDSIKISGLTPSTTYQWQVATKCLVNGITVYSDYSPTKMFTTDAALVEDVTNNYDDATVQTFITLFPNPASTVLNIVVPKYEAGMIINIADVYGKTVLSQQITSASTQLNLQKLINGTYQLNLINRNGTVVETTKFVKQ